MTYVLVHGGASTGRFWDRLLPHLDGPALAPSFPGRLGKPGDLATLTVDDEAQAVVDDVRAAGVADPIVLVVHSSGGLTVPSIVGGLDGQVSHIVLNAASIPPEGGSGLDCMQPRHADGVKLAKEIADKDGSPIFTSGPPEDPESFRSAYGGDPLDDEALAYVVDPERVVVDTMNHYFQPVHWSRIDGVPVTYLLNERDRPIPAPLQEEMVSRLATPPTVVRLDTGHIPAVTMPGVFAELVRAAVTPSG